MIIAKKEHIEAKQIELWHVALNEICRRNRCVSAVLNKKRRLTDRAWQKLLKSKVKNDFLALQTLNNLLHELGTMLGFFIYVILTYSDRFILNIET